MNEERALELESKVFKVIFDAGCGDQGEVFMGALELDDLDVDKLKTAKSQLESLKEEYGPDSHDLLDKEIEALEELIEAKN